jgi:lipoprotein-releasing system permease protein
MRFEFFLAKRFLSGQRFGVFRQVTTLIAIGGTALGVAALLVTLAVMDGFRTDIQEKILGTQPHIMVVNPFGSMTPENPALQKELATTAHVTGVAPYISGQVLLQSERRVTGLMLRGIVPQEERKVTRLEGILVEGRWEALSGGGIILGQELASAVGARTGDTVTLIAPQQEQGPALGQTPRMRRYKVVGLFRSGMYEYDANLAYVTLASARDILGLHQEVSGYGLRLDNLDHTLDTAAALQPLLPTGLWTRSWQDLNKPLFAAMKLERTVMFIILTLIILVSAFTIISNLLLLTIEKAREIGILQALGASPAQVGRIFVLNGLLLGGSGVGLGLLLGVGISFFLKKYPIIQLPADVYYVDRLPIRLSLETVESVALCALVLVLASILYPAWKAREMDPVQAIRYG